MKVVEFMKTIEFEKIEKQLKKQLKKLLPNEEEKKEIEEWEERKAEFRTRLLQERRELKRKLFGDNLPPSNTKWNNFSEQIEKWNVENPKPGIDQFETYTATKRIYADGFVCVIKIELSYNGDTERWGFERSWKVENNKNKIEVWNVFDFGTCCKASEEWEEIKPDIMKMFGDYIRM